MFDDKIAVVIAITIIVCFGIFITDQADMIDNAISALAGLATGMVLTKKEDKNETQE